MQRIKLIESRTAAASATVDKLSVYILVTPVSAAGAVWQRLPYGSLIRQRQARLVESRESGPEPFVTDLPNKLSTRVVHLALEPALTTFERLTAARKQMGLALETNPVELGISVAGFAAAITEQIIETLIAAALAKTAGMPSFKSEPVHRLRLARIKVLGFVSRHAYAQTFAEAAGNALARYLMALPPNELTPEAYRERVVKLARERRWRCEFLDLAALKRRGAGAFLAVAQASASADAGILHLSYEPPQGTPRQRLALVGKGICFDTGGVNLKPQRQMLGMHEDMGGSAVALGTLLALSALEVDFGVDCWLALASNDIGPKAYRPNEVVTALDGTTIEIIHTDAEGRMVLADTLTMASRAKPSLLIDYATLTSACIHALGKAYSGIFTNRDEWSSLLIETGRMSGERVWPFPLDADYDKGLESTIADLKQCAVEGEADHILAARFLSRFVKHEVPWIHLDLAASNRHGGLAHIPTDVTGFGVRYTLALVLQQGLLRRL